MRFSVRHACVALLGVFMGFGAMALTLPGPVVEADWLIANKNQVQILEVRADVKSFTGTAELATDKASGLKQVVEVGGRIPGALAIDFGKIRVTRKMGELNVPAMIPEQAAFQSLVQAAGVQAGRPIVIVPMGLETDDVDQALRLYWQFKVYGEDQVAVLNGGTAAWLLAGQSTAPEALSTKTGNWVSTAVRMQWVADSEDAAKAIDNKQQLIDARAATQYHGLVLRKGVLTPGHIAGAKSVTPDLLTYNKQGAAFLYSPKVYNGLFQQMGISSQQATIAYCNTGHLASGAWFVMSEVVGNPNTRLYDGSMTQWTMEKRPTVTVQK
jgi:thiosulfate/3-mercaptopyruvate sulfurtransferase